MPRGVKRQPQPPVEEPVVEAAPEPEPEPEPVPEIKTEPKFGDDPDDLYGAESAAATILVAAALGRMAKVVYSGLRVAKGEKADAGPIAVTLTVPPGRDYDSIITSGVTYTFHRGQPCAVDEDDVDWLTKHPAFVIDTE